MSEETGFKIRMPNSLRFCCVQAELMTSNLSTGSDGLLAFPPLRHRDSEQENPEQNILNYAVRGALSTTPLHLICEAGATPHMLH
jgi:hypothetical protein